MTKYKVNTQVFCCVMKYLSWNDVQESGGTVRHSYPMAGHTGELAAYTSPLHLAY
jgi:hypothetical protein